MSGNNDACSQQLGRFPFEIDPAAVFVYDDRAVRAVVRNGASAAAELRAQVLPRYQVLIDNEVVLGSSSYGDHRARRVYYDHCVAIFAFYGIVGLRIMNGLSPL